jgi:hypothetical protein
VAAKGDEIALPMRIVQLAVDAAFQRLLGGAERVVCATSEKVERTGIEPVTSGLQTR